MRLLTFGFPYYLHVTAAEKSGAGALPAHILLPRIFRGRLEHCYCCGVTLVNPGLGCFYGLTNIWTRATAACKTMKCGPATIAITKNTNPLLRGTDVHHHLNAGCGHTQCPKPLWFKGDYRYDAQGLDHRDVFGDAVAAVGAPAG